MIKHKKFQYQISAPVFSIKLIKNRLSVKYAPVITVLSCRGRTSTYAVFPPLKISPFPFCLQCKDFFKAGRGIYEDLCRRLPFYPSDFTDGTLHGDLKLNHPPYYATAGGRRQFLICLSPSASVPSVQHLCHS